MSGIILFVFRQQALEQKSCDKPAGRIVQPDHFSEIPAGALVIPGTQFAFLKPQSGRKFTGEDHAGIHQTTEYEVMTAQRAGERSEQGGEPVDREHPDGGRAGQAQVSLAESVKRGKEHFEKPAQQSAMNIVVNKFFHIIRITAYREIMRQYININRYFRLTKACMTLLIEAVYRRPVTDSGREACS